MEYDFANMYKMNRHPPGSDAWTETNKFITDGWRLQKQLKPTIGERGGAISQTPTETFGSPPAFPITKVKSEVKEKEEEKKEKETESSTVRASVALMKTRI